MKSTASLFFVIVLMLGLAGCLPTSTNPLSSPEEALADTRLVGVWYGKSGEDTIFLHFVQDKNAMMDIVEVDHQQNTGAHTTIYTMFPTIIGGQRYMNIREKKGAEKSAYYFARYNISKAGALTLWLMSEKPAAKAIKAETIAGKVTVKNAGESTETRDVAITATTASLAAFVAKSDPETLFAEKFGTFKKITLPSLDQPVAAETPAKNTKPATTPTAKPKVKKKPTA